VGQAERRQDRILPNAKFVGVTIERKK